MAVIAIENVRPRSKLRRRGTGGTCGRHALVVFEAEVTPRPRDQDVIHGHQAKEKRNRLFSARRRGSEGSKSCKEQRRFNFEFVSSLLGTYDGNFEGCSCC